MSPSLSIVLSTFNRAAHLDDALRALGHAARARARASAALHAADVEVIVVDNNSTDSTPGIVARHARGPFALRYLREERQGLAYARNTGIAAASAPLVAFTDDDVRVEPDWIEAMLDAWARHPEAAWIGGKVLPLWPANVPRWIDRAAWAPLALLDYGDVEERIDAARLRCLVGANLAVSREVLRRCGGFSATVQRVGDGVGSTEDHELQARLASAGYHGIYTPAARVLAPVDPARLTRRFHRRWHARHGRSFARMRLAEFEESRRGRLGGVPAHVFRAAAAAAASAVFSRLANDPPRAHSADARLAFASGFIAERARATSGLPALQSRRPTWPLTVSVVIPCFNQGHFLHHAIESALAQSWPSTEILVVDDGSSDETANVVAQHPEVRYVRQRHAGVSAARNTGLVEGEGDFIVFLDADDELVPDAVETGVGRLMSDPRAAFTAGVALPIDEAGRPRPSGPPAIRCGVTDRYDILLRTNFIWTPGAALFRRALLLRAGGFDVRWSAAADYELYLRVAREWPIDWHGRPVVRYRQHEESMSRRLPEILIETLAVIDEAGAQRTARAGWQRWYADRLSDAIAAEWRRGDWLAASRAAATLASCCPADAFRHFRRALSRRLHAGTAIPASEI